MEEKPVIRAPFLLSIFSGQLWDPQDQPKAGLVHSAAEKRELGERERTCPGSQGAWRGGGAARMQVYCGISVPRQAHGRQGCRWAGPQWNSSAFRMGRPHAQARCRRLSQSPRHRAALPGPVQDGAPPSPSTASCSLHVLPTAEFWGNSFPIIPDRSVQPLLCPQNAGDAAHFCHGYGRKRRLNASPSSPYPATGDPSSPVPRMEQLEQLEHQP